MYDLKGIEEISLPLFTHTFNSVKLRSKLLASFRKTHPSKNPAYFFIKIIGGKIVYFWYCCRNFPHLNILPSHTLLQNPA